MTQSQYEYYSFLVDTGNTIEWEILDNENIVLRDVDSARLLIISPEGEIVRNEG